MKTIVESFLFLLAIFVGLGWLGFFIQSILFVLSGKFLLGVGCAVVTVILGAAMTFITDTMINI
jgi:hypothetical protein